MSSPRITYNGLLDCQVCVPAGWDDDQVLDFANAQNPCGTSTGWKIRREGNPALKGYPERNLCEHDEGFVHIMLDA